MSQTTSAPPTTTTNAKFLGLDIGCPAIVPGIKTSYGYTPSEAAGIIFIILFTFSMLGHLFMSIRKRERATAIVLAVGCLTETLGWAGRLWSSQCPYNNDAFLMQITTLIIAPTFFSAGAYIILGKLIIRAGPKSSIISPRMYLYVFVTCDVISLVIQAIGGGKASVESNKVGGNTKPGTDTMVGGIVFQMGTMTIFTVLLLDFLRRVSRLSDSLTRGARLLIAAMSLSVLTIYIRSIYRTIELLQGWSGFLISHQRYFIALDASMMIIATGVYNFFSPAILLDDRHSVVGGGALGGGEGERGLVGDEGQVGDGETVEKKEPKKVDLITKSLIGKTRYF